MKRTNRARPDPRPMRPNGAGPDELAFLRLATRLPDAAPDDLLVERVWRRLQTPDPGPARVWPWVGALTLSLALLAGVALWWFAGASGTRAEVLLSEGGVFVGASGDRWVPARQGDPISAGARLRTDASGRAVLRLPEVAAMVLGTDADLVMDRLGRSTALRLRGGSVTLRVSKRPRERPFVVYAGYFTVKVVGTLFSVTEARTGVVEVEVSEGIVEVAGRGERWRVTAGQRWSSAAPAERARGEIAEARQTLLAAAASVPPSSDLPELLEALVHSEGPPPVPVAHERSEPPAVLPPPMPDAPLAPLTPSVEGAERTTTHRKRPEPPFLARIDPSPPPPSFEPPPVVVTPTQTPTPTPAEVSTSAPPPAPILATPPARTFYAEALNLARHGEHRKAAATLEQALAVGEAPRDLELYQLALLRQRHLNDPQGALDSLRGYREQFPGGALRQEVDLSVVQVDVALGRTEEALAESAHFLAQHPQSERADEVRVLRGDLLRERGDFAAASGEYRSVSGGAALDDALYYWAYCQRQLGNSRSAARALRDYVGRFPKGRHIAAAREALGQ